MLLEFRASNYRSFRNVQSLSLIPIKKDYSLAEANVYETGSSIMPSVLKGCAIYGPNAGGKSNLIRAMAIMQALVKDSATIVKAGQPLNVQPFALNAELKKEPCFFEITVLLDGIRYQYGFSTVPERILEEWLLVYKSAKPQEWFSRKWNQKSGQDEYTFSSYFLGGKEIWKQATRSNALFLSTAVQLNNEQLRPLWDWIVSSWVIIPAQASLRIELTVDSIGKDVKKASILELLNSADLGIADITVERIKAKQATFSLDAATGKTDASDSIETELRLPRLKHKGEGGEAAFFNFDDESQGTQRLFAFAGIIIHILEQGFTLVVDELENSMHPLLVRHILGLFFSSRTNPRGAQIVFSTHNTSLLDRELFRRDQIWFTEKGSDLGSTLVPLSEFSARKTEAFEKGYLEGRYGALPILRSFNSEKECDAET
jgi:AAA15 family ATPase/GTPase